MLYVASDRLNAEGFIFASLLDRPLIPFAMAILWYLNIVPWSLALVFSIQDFGSFLWRLFTWRGEQRAKQSQREGKYEQYHHRFHRPWHYGQANGA
jgi:hypothetical protein